MDTLRLRILEKGWLREIWRNYHEKNSYVFQKWCNINKPNLSHYNKYSPIYLHYATIIGFPNKASHAANGAYSFSPYALNSNNNNNNNKNQPLTLWKRHHIFLQLKKTTLFYNTVFWSYAYIIHFTDIHICEFVTNA